MSLDSSRAEAMGVTYTSPVNAAAGALAVAAVVLSSMRVLLVVSGFNGDGGRRARRGAGSWRRRGLEAGEQVAGQGWARRVSCRRDRAQGSGRRFRRADTARSRRRL